MAINLSDNILAKTTAPSDSKYGPYSGASLSAALASANAYLLPSYRYKGLTIGILVNSDPIVEYWFYSGIEDIDLIIKENGAGGSIKSINVINSNTTAGNDESTEYTYLASGTIDITLPTAVGNTNNYYIKNTGTGTVTIKTTGSETIDGSLTAPLPVQYTALTLVSDQLNWFII